jgi:hypothetical protein
VWSLWSARALLARDDDVPDDPDDPDDREPELRALDCLELRPLPGPYVAIDANLPMGRATVGAPPSRTGAVSPHQVH